MADWNCIEYGFNAADETINFGTRKFGGIDNLYETSTLAQLRNSHSEFNTKPSIKAIINNGLIYFSINKTMRVFDNLLCSNISFSSTFDEFIDEFCVSSDSQYLLLCLRSGVVYCFNMKEGGKIVYSKQICDNEDMHKPLFLKADFYDKHNFVLIIESGKVFSFKENPNSTSETNDLDLFDGNTLTNFYKNIEILGYTYPSLFFMKSNEFCIYNIITNEVTSANISSLKKAFLINSLIILGLHKDGSLIQICPKTFLIFDVDIPLLFEDLELINCDYLLGITKKDEMGSYITRLTYPEYSTVFSLKASEEINLIIPENVHDELMYISEIQEHDEDIRELRFQVISETSPTDRLKRLLRRQKFEEAEKFAKLFTLDITDVQKAKAQAIVDKRVCDENDICNLITILDSLNDEAFKLQCCLDIHSSCNNPSDVQKILNYGCSSISNIPDRELQCFRDMIFELMFRFNTFLMIVRCDNVKFTNLDWFNFSVCDLIEEMIKLLKHKHIEESIILCNRLDVTTMLNINDNDINNILNIINEIPIQNQLAFLNDFIPRMLNYLPSTTKLFIKWTTEQIFNIEAKYSSQFPKNAINFINKMVQLLKVDNYSDIISFGTCTTAHSSFKHLTNMYGVLKKLETLKKDYRIVISLEQILQGTEVLIQTLLNYVIYEHQSEYFLEDFIQKFILDNQIEPDDIFEEVIKDLTKYEEEYWIKIVPIILNNFGSLAKRLEATIVILKAANVPWCSTIRKIANESLEYSHPAVQNIVREIDYEFKSVILKKEPYNLTKCYNNTMEFFTFAIKRMIHCNQPTLIEDVYQVCKDSREKSEADMLLILHFIMTGNFNDALKIIDSSENIKECCENILTFVHLGIHNQYKNITIRDNYYNIMGSIFHRLQKSGCEEGYLKKYFKNLKGVYHISKTFNINITYRDLNDNASKNKILDSLICAIVEEFQYNNNIYPYIEKCKHIATHLQMNTDIVLLKFCKKVSDFNVILKAAEIIYIGTSDTKILCSCVMLILTYLGTSNSQDSTELLLQDFSNIDLSKFIDGLLMGNNMMVKALLNCTKYEISSCLELANWVQITYYLMREKRHAFSLSKEVYGEDILPSISAFNAIKNVFNFYISFIDNNNSPNTRYLMFFNHDTPRRTEAQLINDIQFLPETIKCLCMEGHALTAYKLMIVLQNALSDKSNIDENTHVQLKEMINYSRTQLLHNVFAARFFDKELAYNLLETCEAKFATNFLFEHLKFYKRNLLKFEAIAQLNIRFTQMNNIEQGRSVCVNIIHLAKWWRKLDCQIPYDEFFKASANVLHQLINLKSISVNDLEEFCSDFDLNVQNYYLYYLEKLLLNWKPEYEIQINNFNEKKLIIKNSEEELLRDCLEVIDFIVDKETVIHAMNSIWTSTNFYHYEVFMSVLKILFTLKSTEDNNQNYMLLLFLKNYKRISEPGNTETEQWFTSYPDTQHIDILSEWRLPFTPTLLTNEIWSIIRPEINLKTYNKWFEAITILPKYLCKDHICIYAVKKILTNDILNSQNSKTWTLYVKHETLVEEIDKCVQNISNLQKATSAIYCLIKNFPRGADLVNIAKLCYNYALKYQNDNPNVKDVEKVVIKVKSKYFNFATTHILHLYQLADDKYLEMVTNPIEELIETLYMDKRILDKSLMLQCPDINKAVDELGKLYGIDIFKKRVSLLNEWLSDISVTDINFSTDSQNMTNICNQSKYNSNIGHKNLIRASYLCTSGEASTWHTLLLKLGKIDLKPSKDLCFKVMALKCFCSISDINTIEKLTGKTFVEFRKYINKLMLISGLEPLGFSFTTKLLDDFNKNELLNSLSRYVNNNMGIKLMVSVCVIYEIYESKYWVFILKTMMKLNMINELKECIIFLKDHFEFQKEQYYIEAWKMIIKDSFEFSPNTKENDIKNKCLDNLHFIQTCPVLFSLDFEYIAKKCFTLKQFNLLLLILQYLKKEQQQHYIKELHNLNINIYNKINELSEHGLLGTSYVKKLLIEFENENF